MVFAVVLCSRSPAVPTGEPTEGVQAWGQASDSGDGMDKKHDSHVILVCHSGVSAAVATVRVFTPSNHPALVLQDPLNTFSKENAASEEFCDRYICIVIRDQRTVFELRTLEYQCGIRDGCALFFIRYLRGAFQ